MAALELELRLEAIDAVNAVASLEDARLLDARLVPAAKEERRRGELTAEPPPFALAAVPLVPCFRKQSVRIEP
jgi:hypothetical protein